MSRQLKIVIIWLIIIFGIASGLNYWFDKQEQDNLIKEEKIILNVLKNLRENTPEKYTNTELKDVMTDFYFSKGPLKEIVNMSDAPYPIKFVDPLKNFVFETNRKDKTFSIYIVKTRRYIIVEQTYKGKNYNTLYSGYANKNFEKDTFSIGISKNTSKKFFQDVVEIENDVQLLRYLKDKFDSSSKLISRLKKEQNDDDILKLNSRSGFLTYTKSYNRTMKDFIIKFEKKIEQDKLNEEYRKKYEKERENSFLYKLNKQFQKDLDEVMKKNEIEGFWGYLIFGFIGFIILISLLGSLFGGSSSSGSSSGGFSGGSSGSGGLSSSEKRKERNKMYDEEDRLKKIKDDQDRIDSTDFKIGIVNLEWKGMSINDKHKHIIRRKDLYSCSLEAGTKTIRTKDLEFMKSEIYRHYKDHKELIDINIDIFGE